MQISWTLLAPLLILVVSAGGHFRQQTRSFGWGNDRWDDIMESMEREQRVYSDEELIKLTARATNFLRAIPYEHKESWTSNFFIDGIRATGWRFAPVLDETYTSTISGSPGGSDYRIFDQVNNSIMVMKKPWTSPQIDLIAFRLFPRGWEPTALIRPMKRRLTNRNPKLSFHSVHNLDFIFGRGYTRGPLYGRYIEELKKRPAPRDHSTPQAFFQHVLNTFQRRAGFPEDSGLTQHSSSIASEAVTETRDFLSQLAASSKDPASLVASSSDAASTSKADEIASETKDFLSQLADKPWRPSS